MLYDGRNLTVRDADDGPFVAISHVWADGLGVGSTAEVGLVPTCQVARIANLARLLVPDGAVWIDSLCVSDSKALRNRAIGLMAATYRQAERVLVLDATIWQLAIKTPPKELILRLALSPWMHRVWTLPEGLLAREIHFECVDGLGPNAHLKDLLASCRELVPSSALGPILSCISTFIPPSCRCWSVLLPTVYIPSRISSSCCVTAPPAIPKTRR